MAPDDEPLPLHNRDWMPYADAFHRLYQDVGGDIELVEDELRRLRRKWVRRVGFPPRFEHRLLPADEDPKVTILMQQVGNRMMLDENWRDEIEFELDGELGELFVWGGDFKALSAPEAAPEPSAAEPASPVKPEPAQPKHQKRKKKPSGGRPPDYDSDAVRQAAEDFIKDVGLPGTNAMLMEKVMDELGASAPGVTRLKELTAPIFKREDAKRAKAIQQAVETCIENEGPPRSIALLTERVAAVLKAESVSVPEGPWLKSRVAPIFERHAGKPKKSLTPRAGKSR